MEVILDSSFILSCIDKKIDFVTELESLGFRIVLPREVMQEIKGLQLSGRQQNRIAAGIAMSLFSSKAIKKTTLGNISVDEGLIKKGKSGIFVATLDREIKRHCLNRVVISSSGKNLVIERE